MSPHIRGCQRLDRRHHRGEVVRGAAGSRPGLRREDRGAPGGQDHHRIGGAGKGADGEERVKGAAGVALYFWSQYYSFLNIFPAARRRGGGKGFTDVFDRRECFYDYNLQKRDGERLLLPEKS